MEETRQQAPRNSRAATSPQARARLLARECALRGQRVAQSRNRSPFSLEKIRAKRGTPRFCMEVSGWRWCFFVSWWCPLQLSGCALDLGRFAKVAVKAWRVCSALKVRNSCFASTLMRSPRTTLTDWCVFVSNSNPPKWWVVLLLCNHQKRGTLKNNHSQMFSSITQSVNGGLLRRMPHMTLMAHGARSSMQCRPLARIWLFLASHPS